MPCRTIAIMNQKGGVGKTTTTLNLGAALAEAGKRVMLVDLDPQANLTRGLGVEVVGLQQSTYDALTNPDADINSIVQATLWDRLDIAPSHIDLSGAEIEMVTMYGREGRLSNSLRNVVGIYDYILIDCLPSLSLLTINAMTAASEILVPMQAHPFALEGLGKLFDVFALIHGHMNPDLRLGGVLVTMFDTRTNVSREVVDRLRSDERTNNAIYDTVVRQNIKIAESQSVGVPVIHYDPTCHGAVAYRALAQEVIAQETGGQVDEPPMAQAIAVEDNEFCETLPEVQPEMQPEAQVQPEVQTQPETQEQGEAEGGEGDQQKAA